MDYSKLTDDELDACTQRVLLDIAEEQERVAQWNQVMQFYLENLLRDLRLEARRRYNGSGYNGKAGH